MLHGPAGSGKTHLVKGLVSSIIQRRPDVVVTSLSASDLGRVEQPVLFESEIDKDQSFEALDEGRNSDLLVLEDLQRLNGHAVETLVQVVDCLLARQRFMAFTANVGPQALGYRGHRFPARLANRLASGLVIALEPLGSTSRLTLLQTLAQRRQLAVPTEVLRWLAEHLSGGGRQLEGAIVRLETLAKLHHHPLSIAKVAEQFHEQADAGRVTVERIAQRVSGYFRVDPGELQSRRRYRNVMLPRQVGMYLARQLTELSLEQIGTYFGGRDHSTVLHACRRVEEALESDTMLSGAIREIHAGLA
jgi:chromosomal replication initiator protein